MIQNKLIIKWLIFFAGLFLMAFGVALAVKADLGISPISCVPYILSLKYPLTLGMWTIVFNALLILLQIIVLGKNYRIFQLIQLPVIFILGFFIDFALYLVSGIKLSGYLWRLILCLFSCIIISFGVFIEVKAKTTYLPGEGLALAVSETLNIEFGKVKIWVDSSMVGIGIVSSFILLGSLEGIREGTAIAALLTGYIARFFVGRIKIFNKILI